MRTVHWWFNHQNYGFTIHLSKDRNPIFAFARAGRKGYALMFHKWVKYWGEKPK